MNAVLTVEPITVQPIPPARYNNARIANFGNWYRDNEPALVERFNKLAGEGDFQDFAFTQYDLQRLANPQPIRYIERLTEREAFCGDR